MRELIKEFRTTNFRIVLDAVEDYDVDLSFDEDGSVRKGLENGSLVAFSARATVYFNGHDLATEYLGGCIYKSTDEFWDLREVGEQNRKFEANGEAGRCGSYARQMISEAIAQARGVVKAMQNVKVREAA